MGGKAPGTEFSPESDSVSGRPDSIVNAPADSDPFRVIILFAAERHW